MDRVWSSPASLPACRTGDAILEAFGQPDMIGMGELTVIIGP